MFFTEYESPSDDILFFSWQMFASDQRLEITLHSKDALCNLAMKYS